MSSIGFPDKLVRLLRTSSRVAVLTGAGVSQESGLRTFRDAQTGIWTQHRPEDLASPEAFRRDAQLVWDWYAWRREAIKGVRPNPGHYALVEMERRLAAFTLITQNVDGLHRLAGTQHVLELHGNILRVRCSECGRYGEEGQEEAQEVPRCTICSGLMRPDVVWFGEMLPQAELQAAVEAARACQVFFSIGTSSLVQPAASLALMAKQSGAIVVEINPEATPLTVYAEFFLQGKSGVVLPELEVDPAPLVRELHRGNEAPLVYEEGLSSRFFVSFLLD